MARARLDRGIVDMKRTLDVVGSSMGLLVLSPILIALSVLVRLSMGSPVFFRQRRPGLQGQPFVILKFRTMTNERDVDGDLLPEEERLTTVGRFLRSASLDELPELWNVLRGEMSLVGPRPLLMEYLPRYTDRQARRHEVRPGITGWAQVNGRNARSWEERLEMDVWYVENQSLWLDLKILCQTVVKVLKREGVTQPGHVTVERFQGQSGNDAS